MQLMDFPVIAELQERNYLVRNGFNITIFE